VTDIDDDLADSFAGLALSYAETVYVYAVEAETDESVYVVPEVTEARYVPPLYTL